MEELRWAWAGVLLGWWAPQADRWSRELQPNLPDIAARALVDGWDSPALRELAGAPASDTAAARELLAQVMAELGFVPPEPAASPWQRVRTLLVAATADNLERWLALVQHDVDAGAPDIGPLQLRFLPSGRVVIALANGDHSGQTFDEIHCWERDDAPTLVNVVSSAQDCLSDVMQRLWPVCPLHGHLLLAREAAERTAWMCDANGGHVVAGVGSLSGCVVAPA